MRHSLIGRPIWRSFSVILGTVAGLTLVAPGVARAHFLWLTAERDKPAVHAFLSETTTPGGPEFLEHIAKARITAGGKVLSWSKAEDTYRISLPDPCPEVIDGWCDLGIKQRNGVRFNLLYTARLQFEPSRGDSADEADHLRLRFVAPPGKDPFVVVRFRGQPAAGAVVKAYPEEGDPVELKSDAMGHVEHASLKDRRTSYLAKWSEKSPGKRDGKPYDEVRHYATLTLAPASSSKTEAPAAPDSATAFAQLPEAVNSFGGAVLGNWLYVYSGHTGETHHYDETTTTKHFRRLDLTNRTTWEELPCGPALQGVALVAHEDALYRIGGMAAHNRKGEPNRLKSVADFARFDPQKKSWSSLPPLPTPRSTHDAVVMGDRIYVIGGWSLPGGSSEDATFLDTALVFDLAEKDGRWQNLPSPLFRRRALTVAAIKGKVYVLGGLTDAGTVVKSVDIYDPETGTWSRGPDFPGGKRQGFGASAFGVDDRLYLSGIDGVVNRLNQSGDGWEIVGRLSVPRLTHRLLPGIGDDLLVVGGSHARASVASIESIPLAVSESRPK